jgi:hypothetical protein
MGSGGCDPVQVVVAQVVVHRWIVTMHSTWCSSHDPYNVRRGGGVGERYVDVEGGAYFDCPTGVPWVETHWHIWLVVRYWGGGGVQVIDRS